MKDERIKVLEMVEQGKINVDEAAKLLEALKATEDVDNSSDFQEKINAFSQNVESFAKDVGDKMGTAFKGMEPKIRKATKVVVEKTANLVDDISKALNESLKNLEECAGENSEECDCNEESCNASEEAPDNEPKEN